MTDSLSLGAQDMLKPGGPHVDETRRAGFPVMMGGHLDRRSPSPFGRRLWARRRRLVVLAASAALLATSAAGHSVQTEGAAQGPPTHAADPEARYRLVHLDTLDAKLQPLFEGARREWVGVLNARGQDDGRGVYFLQDGHTLVSVHAFQTFEELAALRRFQAGINDRLGKDGEALTRRYDAGDVALRSPHRTEIWEHDPDSDYRPSRGALDEFNAGYMLVEEEFVASGDYYQALKEIDAALYQANYPLTRRVFYSSPGTGQQVTFWLAPTRLAFAQAGTPYDAVAKVLGAEKALALFKRFKLTSNTYQAHHWEQRPDLNRH